MSRNLLAMAASGAYKRTTTEDSDSSRLNKGTQQPSQGHSRTMYTSIMEDDNDEHHDTLTDLQPPVLPVPQRSGSQGVGQVLQNSLQHSTTVKSAASPTFSRDQSYARSHSTRAPTLKSTSNRWDLQDSGYYEEELENTHHVAQVQSGGSQSGSGRQLHRVHLGMEGFDEDMPTVKLHVTINPGPESQRVDDVIKYINSAAQDDQTSPDQSDPSVFDVMRVLEATGIKNGATAFLVQVKPINNSDTTTTGSSGQSGSQVAPVHEEVRSIDSAGSVMSERGAAQSISRILKPSSSKTSDASARTYVLAMASDVEDDDDVTDAHQVRHRNDYRNAIVCLMMDSISCRWCTKWTR